MSASLVGSEMCIRDSELLTLKPLPLGAVLKTNVRRLEVGTRHRCPSVSYTHLTLPTICSV
eukprot:2553480-Alexandrium_andersonii.AAC.1